MNEQQLMKTIEDQNQVIIAKDATIELLRKQLGDAKSELKELLPNGTRLQVEKQVLYDGIETTPPTKTQTTTVESVTTSFLTEEPLIKTTNGAFLKEWFKIVED